jgi:tRNA pseudouridine32 synthase/23S rRNA pseudouridine746 synthase
MDPHGPHPIARAAMDHLRRCSEPLRSQLSNAGKMIGVLVVADPRGRLGYLRAFSGSFHGRWRFEGWAPPVFDEKRQATLLVAAEPALHRLTTAIQWLESADLASWSAELQRSHTEERDALAAALKQRRAQRRAERDAGANAQRAHELDQQSRGDAALRRRLLASQAKRSAASEVAVERWRRRLRALVLLRARASRDLQRLLHDQIRVPGPSGIRMPLRALFAPGEPPTGAGDCAAPKLLAAARAQGLRPVALAEQWWGPPPATGGRVDGGFYPACARKCAPLMPTLLQGLPVAPPRPITAPPNPHGGLRFLALDDALVVVDKPPGLLSVPGRGANATDSVQTRLRRRFPEAVGPLVVHRLDLDVGGALVSCLDLDSYRAVQRQFAARSVGKQYVAIVEGIVEQDAGVIELPLRVDLDDRPRQIVDNALGKLARTRWQVIGRESRTTRVHLFPETGRTHQLRVHCAHPNGLSAPIVGDRLYGHIGGPLLLHAERIDLRHPTSDRLVEFRSPPPF